MILQATHKESWVSGAKSVIFAKIFKRKFDSTSIASVGLQKTRLKVNIPWKFCSFW